MMLRGTSHAGGRTARTPALAAIIAALVAGPSAAPPAVGAGDAPAGAPTYGAESVSRYRFGARVTATAAPVAHAKLVMAVPLACPEQTFELLDEDRSERASVVYRQADDGVRQMVITVRGLPAGQEAHAYATFEVRTRVVGAPADVASLKIPARASAPLRRYLAASPMIQVNDRRIKAAVAAATGGVAEVAGDWRRVEALYDYALAHVAYKLGDDKSAVDALADGQGDCQALAALFVAMCRTMKVPARMVWVDGHQYAEFYLEAAPRQGHWYPVESAGTRSFGGMPLARVILQKGDSIRTPERRGEQLRYASDFAVFPVPPAAPPAIAFVREKLGADGAAAVPDAVSGAQPSSAESSSAASSAAGSP